MSNVIKIRRGIKSGMPTLASGELGWATDTKKLYVGDGSNNHQIAADILNASHWASGVSYNEGDLIWAPDGKHYLYLDASDSAKITIPSNSSLDISGDLTVEFWVRFKAWPSGWTTIIGRLNSDANNMFHLRLRNNSGTIEGNFYYGDGTSVQGLVSWDPDIQLNEWHHIAAVKDQGSHITIYVDGALSDTDTCPDVAGATPSSDILIGEDYQGTRWQDMDIRDVRLWNVARTQTQLSDNRFYIPSGTTTGLVGSWPMDEGYGTTASDITNNKNHGTITSGEWISNYTFDLMRAVEAHTSGNFYEDLANRKWRETGFGAEITTIENNVTYQIPSDFSTLQEAFNTLGHHQIKPGVTVTFNIESGHKLTDGLKLVGGDYSQFKITSSDATVYLATGFNAVDGTEYLSHWDNIAFIFANCRAPEFDILVDCENRTSASLYAGLIYVAGAIGSATSGSGVKDGNVNLEVRNAIFYGRYTIFDNSRFMCIRVTASSIADITGASCNYGCSDYSASNVGALDVSRGSIIYANNVTINDSYSCGLYVRRSRAVAQDAEIKNSGHHGVLGDVGSEICVYGATVTGATGGYYDLTLFPGGAFIWAGTATYSSTSETVNSYGSKGAILDSSA